jgi:hypothetical protein
MTCVNTFSVLLILTKKVFENLLCNLEVKVNQTLLGWFFEYSLKISKIVNLIEKRGMCRFQSADSGLA